MRATYRSTSQNACMRMLVCCIVAALAFTFLASGSAYAASKDFSLADLMPITVYSADRTTSVDMALAPDGSTYAYSIRVGFFVTDGKEGCEPTDVPASGYKEKDVKGAIHNLDWSEGYGLQVLQSMATMEKVDDFWRNEVGISGIDGKNSLYRLSVLPEVLGGGARCLSRSTEKSKVYSYAILLGLAPDGNTIGAYPEILCHEYTHAVLSNIVQYENYKGEHGALNEAIADIFAAAYLKDPSWHLAAGLSKYKSDRDIKSAKRTTMSDYNYDVAGLSIGGWLMEQYLNATNKTDTASEDIYENSYIISHTVYKIWKGPFGQDFSKLTATMSTALPYIPSDADFGDFREVFTAAARFLYGDDMAKDVEKYFDKAGIKDKGDVIINEAISYDGDGNRISVPSGDTSQIGESQPEVSQPTPSRTTVEDYRSVLVGSGARYYAMLDLNGDGTDELLAAESVYDGNRAESASIYAIHDGVPRLEIGFMGSSLNYLKYDATSRSILTTWGGGGGAQWITYYMVGSECRVDYLTELVDDGSHYIETCDSYWNRVSYEDLDRGAFDERLATWKERDARASYISFTPLPF